MSTQDSNQPIAGYVHADRIQPDTITITRPQLLRACGNAGIPHTTALRIMAYLPPFQLQPQHFGDNQQPETWEQYNLGPAGKLAPSGMQFALMVARANMDEIRAWGAQQYEDGKRAAQQADDTPTPCNADIHAHGAVVAVLDAGKLAMQGLVDEANRTAPGMDWHYVGGRAVVKTLGDPKQARLELKRALPRFIDGGV